MEENGLNDNRFRKSIFITEINNDKTLKKERIRIEIQNRFTQKA
jgi:hypothetical protein